MSNDLKIQIKRVGNGYLISKNFNESVELIRDWNPHNNPGPGDATTEVQQFLQIAACVAEMLGRPEFGSGFCHRIVDEPLTSDSSTVEYYQTVFGESYTRVKSNLFSESNNGPASKAKKKAK